MWRKLTVGGGTAVENASETILTIPMIENKYTDAQLDDYGGQLENGRLSPSFRWIPPCELSLEAKFSHPANQLGGTAGFGFWNAPFGDPTAPRPAMPRAVWFFGAGPANNLPFQATGAGHGWFAGTVNVHGWRAWRWAPAAPLVLLLNRFHPFRQRFWPRVLVDLGVHSQTIDASMTEWHAYRLRWTASACHFWVDDRLVLSAPVAIKGPLGFVCWIDNQYLVVTPNGRIRWGVQPIHQTQTLRIRQLTLQKISPKNL